MVVIFLGGGYFKYRVDRHDRLDRTHHDGEGLVERHVPAHHLEEVQLLLGQHGCWDERGKKGSVGVG